MIDIMSDHNMIMVECMVVGKIEEKRKVQNKKWRLRDVNWESFQVCFSERMWGTGNSNSIDELNERLTENVRSAGASKIRGGMQKGS